MSNCSPTSRLAKLTFSDAPVVVVSLRANKVLAITLLAVAALAAFIIPVIAFVLGGLSGHSIIVIQAIGSVLLIVALAFAIFIKAHPATPIEDSTNQSEALVTVNVITNADASTNSIQPSVSATVSIPGDERRSPVEQPQVLSHFSATLQLPTQQHMEDSPRTPASVTDAHLVGVVAPATVVDLSPATLMLSSLMITPQVVSPVGFSDASPIDPDSITSLAKYMFFGISPIKK